MTQDKNYFEIYTKDDLKTFWLSFMIMYHEESKEFKEKAKEILHDMIDVVFNIGSEKNMEIAKKKQKAILLYV